VADVSGPKSILTLLLLLLLLLQTGNPEIVADLYAPDGVLLPTVSNQVGPHFTLRQRLDDDPYVGALCVSVMLLLLQLRRNKFSF
jgi:hypothetical protein